MRTAGGPGSPTISPATSARPRTSSSSAPGLDRGSSTPSTGLDANGRPRWAADDTGGRFIACRAGFYDPAIFQADREVTVTGVIDGYETRRIGEYDYRFPRLAADVIYLWPVRDRVDVIHDPMPGPWWWW